MALSELYTRAVKTMKQAESMPRSDARQDVYIEARRLLERAMNLIDSLSLFSDNETIDDVATVNIKYLLIPAYLAKVITSSETGPNRVETFTKAENSIKKFLQTVVNYGMGHENVERVLRSEQFDTLGSGPADLVAAQQSRNEKIEKFKRMKTLEFRVEELERRIQSGQEVDEETNREYYLSLVKKWIEDSVESLEREVRPALYFERNRHKLDTSMDADRPSTSSRSESRVNPTNQTITIVRDHLQKQVFGLGYPSRPTVTVDEFISKKINDGDLAFQAQKEVYANSLQKYAEEPKLRQEQEEQSDEEREAKEERDDDEELERKRRWDEFKDDNPRGSGNRYNMG